MSRFFITSVYTGSLCSGLYHGRKEYLKEKRFNKHVFDSFYIGSIKGAFWFVTIPMYYKNKLIK